MTNNDNFRQWLYDDNWTSTEIPKKVSDDEDEEARNIRLGAHEAFFSRGLLDFDDLGISVYAINQSGDLLSPYLVALYTRAGKEEFVVDGVMKLLNFIKHYASALEYLKPVPEVAACNSCKYWRRDGRNNRGECRRRAPTPVNGILATARWPHTDGSDGCGDGLREGA